MLGQALERPVEDEVFEAEEAGEAAAIASEGAGEMAEIGGDGVLAGPDSALVIGKPERVVADRVLEAEHHGRVLPGAAEAEDLDARALAPGMTLVELALERLQALQLLGRQLAEHGVARGRLGA